jgi:hypothetical protein
MCVPIASQPNDGPMFNAEQHQVDKRCDSYVVRRQQESVGNRTVFHVVHHLEIQEHNIHNRNQQYCVDSSRRERESFRFVSYFSHSRINIRYSVHRVNSTMNDCYNRSLVFVVLGHLQIERQQ